MEATLGISLNSYLYLKLAKILCLSYYLFNKIGEQESGTGSAQKEGGGAQTMYTHVSKCKNNKMKEEKVVGRAKKKKNDSKGQ
jgi:hypothetical protein